MRFVRACVGLYEYSHVRFGRKNCSTCFNYGPGTESFFIQVSSVFLLLNFSVRNHDLEEGSDCGALYTEFKYPQQPVTSVTILYSVSSKIERMCAIP